MRKVYWLKNGEIPAIGDEMGMVSPTGRCDYLVTIKSANAETITAKDSRMGMTFTIPTANAHNVLFYE